MNTVLGLIILLSQNNIEKGIAYNLSNFIIDNLAEINNMSMQELAKRCFISTSSVIKYCRLLGFNSYSDFKWQLQSTYQNRKLQLFEKQEKISFEKLFEKIQNLSIVPINQTELFEKVSDTAKIINQTKSIYIYGAVFPVMLTQAFCEDMLMMGVAVHMKHISYAPLEIENNNNDTVMIISISGRFQETHQAEYQKMCQLNPNTILFSQDIEHINNLKINFALPKTDSSEYDDLVLLLTLDMIKNKYYLDFYQR